MKLLFLRDKGIALLSVLIIICCIFIVGLSAVAIGLSTRNNVMYELNRTRALYVAEAGVERAIHQAVGNRSWTENLSTTNYTPVPDRFREGEFLVNLPYPDSRGEIESVEAMKLISGGNDTTINIRSTGTYGSGQSLRRHTSLVTIKLSYYSKKNPFEGVAIYSNKEKIDMSHGLEVTVAGGAIYSRGSVILTADGANVTHVGDIYANGTVTVEGSKAHEITGTAHVPTSFLPGTTLLPKVADDSIAFPVTTNPNAELLDDTNLLWYQRNATDQALPAGMTFSNGGIYYLGSGEDEINLSGNYTGQATIVADKPIRLKGDLRKATELDCLTILCTKNITIESGKTIDALLFSNSDIVFKNGATVNGSLISMSNIGVWSAGGHVTVNYSAAMVNIYDNIGKDVGVCEILNWTNQDYASFPAPVGLRVTDITLDSVSIAWSPIPKANYTVERSADGTTDWAVVASDLNSTYFTDSGLTSGTPYYYRIKAVSGVYTSDPSSVIEATPGLKIPALNAITIPSGVVLSWTSSGDAADITYTVKRTDDIGSSYQDLITTSSLTHTDSVFTSQTYGYYVVANLGGLAPVASNIIWVFVSPITNLTATAGNAQVTLVFPAPTGAISVRLLQSTTSAESGFSDTGISLDASSTHTTVENLTPNQPYWFKLAVTGGPYQGDSNVVAVIPTSSPISDLAATAGNGQVTFTYSPPTGATSVHLLQFTNAALSGYPEREIILDPNSNQTIVSNLTPNQQYWFKLVVTGGPYQGDSNVVTAIPLTIPISDLVATPANKRVYLTFSAPAGAASVQLMQSTTSPYAGFTNTNVSLNASSTSATVKSLVNGTQYWFKVIVAGGPHEGESNVVTATPN